ncbi:winged helix-turn-helix transcriptional regulator [Brevibacterium daeguense]|uniref:Winged helix-turn-helix transcriptional regulator n=1 Tax=Brevibacterium daeguense TaxID=909936 RepID=A0ABP8EFX5_9MICO|nr:winged helix-turn-helix transcriptional regulator [Brevibacterium daeguense]
MRKREYGQFCGLARAAEVVGQRWTLLILRDLLVGPRRYSELRSGLPGIPTNMLATRLKEMEEDGLVVREALTGPTRAIVYRLTQRGAEIAPALGALARWGAAGMRAPREGEVVTEASLVSALRAGITGDAAGRPEADHERAETNYSVTIGDVAVQATVAPTGITVEPGAHPNPDLVISGGPRFRDLLAGELDPRTAIAQGIVVIDGDPALLEDFVRAFSIPYSESTTGDER